MKYKVRDKVRIREDLKADNRYGTQVFVEDMKKYAGKIMTVKACVFAGEYLLEEDNDRWIWTDEMLKGVFTMKYIIGDKVRVRKDLIVGKMYGECQFVDNMKPYMGKTMTISHVNNYSYYLKEDEDMWCWTDEMFEGVEGINILVDGDKVIAERDDKVGIAKCSPEDKFDIFTGVRLAIDRLEEECKPYSWLKNGVTYYFPNVEKNDLYDCFQYANDEIDERLISRGLVFKTKEEAIECAKKMLEVVK